jgi:excisionase family DNA binding protein
MTETTHSAAPAPEPFLTAEQVAELLALQPRTVLRMAGTGELPAHRLTVRTVRFLWSEVDATLRSRCSDVRPGQSSAEAAA